ncbi:MAG: DNA-directed RNA polymerase core subunit rpc40 [Bogoriella megaspora]|nr:MAG: DNA-directed RNA polymerase core subunit rpc40 [Bogoriella megaspora]
MPGATQKELDKRRLVGVNAETITNVTTTEYPGHYPGEDHSWNLEHFRKGFNVKFHFSSPYHSVFSLTGLDTSIANAFRRILLSEIPTLAIEDVYVNNNTSIIADEVLCHRLGLIPLRVQHLQGLKEMHWYFKRPADEAEAAELPETFQESIPTTENTVALRLQAECNWRSDGKKLWEQGEREPTRLYEGSNVYAHQIVYEPHGEQQDILGTIAPVNPDILIAKLRPGQKIDLRMHCYKGIGADHAKWSPVCTASYRLLPTVEITRPILGNEARKFARCFPKGVIGFEKVSKEEASMDGSGYERREGEEKAVVVDTFRDTVSRECLRHEEFKDKVKLGRVRDHFIFSVESTGQYTSDELFVEAVKVLVGKCKRFRGNLQQLQE